ncbi:MAG: BNR repeat-containing protein [Lentisphaeria bacterium]|nr:BNR repeat-containing protein [Lentisphaeria bacterium]
MTILTEPVIEERVVLGKIWSAVSVGFCLLTHENRQYVAYYNADRRMVVGQRDLSDDSFTQMILPSESPNPPNRGKLTSTIQGWDSHNSITMVIDKEGHIHLSGNMHVDPLLYFRTEKPHDITTLIQVKSMVGKNETRCTYPHFMTGPNGNLLFHYRDGWSGNGVEMYNVYDTKTRTWSRLFNPSLISGQGKRNAYQRGPKLGPDGWYHLLWMWRETNDASTNHDVSYARSRDFLHWENAAGEPLKLPITLESPGTIIDPVPVNGGIINTVHRFGFDSQNRVVVSYHKHDQAGNTQAYAARFEDGAWMVKPVSDWEGRHIFKGGGSGPSTYGTSIGLGTVKQHGEGTLALPFRHWQEGHGLLVFDEETFTRIGVEPETKQPPKYPAALTKVQSKFPGMRVKLRGDTGRSPDPSVHYVLRWETLGPNRDRPRQEPLPENSDLVLYKLGNPEKEK